MRFALLLLLLATPLAADSGSAVLTDDVYQLPAGEWRWVPFDTQQKPVMLACHYLAMPGSEVHAELVSRSELPLIQRHTFHDTLDSTDSGRDGAFSRLIREPGEYAVVIENDGKRPAVTRLTVTMSFRPALPPEARFLSKQRQLTVILVSFGLFFAVVTVSARALWKAMGR
jgi:hypothetical protein